MIIIKFKKKFIVIVINTSQYINTIFLQSYS